MAIAPRLFTRLMRRRAAITDGKQGITGGAARTQGWFSCPLCIAAAAALQA